MSCCRSLPGVCSSCRPHNLWLAAAALACAVTEAALADTPAVQDVQLEEVTVTAQKRQQSVQDIGFTVAAVGADRAREVSTDIGSLAGQIPGVEAYGAGTYLQSFFIRGIGLNAFAGNFNGPVAINTDEVYVSKGYMFARPTFDIARIEVLEGPQGTLFGRNTTGGAVNYYTQEPTRDFTGYVRAEGDNFQRYAVEAAVGGPLTDVMAGRLSVQSSLGNSGPQYNVFTQEHWGRPDVQQLRGQLAWDLGETRIRLLAYGGIDKSETMAYKGPGIFNYGAPGAPLTICPQAIAGQVSLAPATCAKFGGRAAALGVPAAEVEPNGTFTIDQNYPPERNDNFYGGYLRIEHDMGTLRFTSLSSFDHYLRRQREDADSSFLETNDTNWYDNINEFTQELRLSGDLLANRMHFVLGAFYEHDHLSQAEDSLLNGTTTVDGVTLGSPFGSSTPPRIGDTFIQTTDSAAAFFNSDFDLTDNFAITTGVRATNDRTHIDGYTFVGSVATDGVEDIPQTILARPASLVATRSDGNVSGRLGATWHASRDVMLYTNLATGYRSGGYSVAFAGPILSFDPEKVVSAELGAKTRLADDRLQLNVSLYRYRYTDLQVNVDDPISPISPVIRNIGASVGYGAESDIQWTPIRALQLHLGYSYMAAKFTETDKVVTTIATLNPVPLLGKTPAETPKHQVSGMVRYTQPISPALDFFGATDARWVAKRFLQPSDQPADATPSYNVVNLRLGIESSDERWAISAWARNLFDSKYQVYTLNLPLVGFKLDIWGEQLSYGLTVERKW